MFYTIIHVNTFILEENDIQQICSEKIQVFKNSLFNHKFRFIFAIRFFHQFFFPLNHHNT